MEVKDKWYIAVEPHPPNDVAFVSKAMALAGSINWAELLPSPPREVAERIGEQLRVDYPDAYVAIFAGPTRVLVIARRDGLV